LESYSKELMKKKQSQGGPSIRHYRICVLGPSFVGKTQLINRFINNGFSPYYDPTTQAQIYRRAFSLFDTDTTNAGGASGANEDSGQGSSS